MVSVRVDAPLRLATAAECVQFERDSFGALHQMLAGLDEPARASAWAEITEQLAAYRNAGRFRRTVRTGRGRRHRTRRADVTVTVAAVQATPVFLDSDATTAKACALDQGSVRRRRRHLVVFPEAFIPAYPDWVWRLPAWSDGPYIERLYQQAVTMPGPITERLGEAARDAGRSWPSASTRSRRHAVQHAALLRHRRAASPDGTAS